MTTSFPRWPKDKVSVLLVSPDKAIQNELEEIFKSTGWVLEHARSYEEVSKILDAESTPSIVLCEDKLPDGEWQDILTLTESCGSELIVATHPDNTRLWSEVLNLGGNDVLLKPLRKEEVCEVIAGTWRYWKRKQRKTKM